MAQKLSDAFQLVSSTNGSNQETNTTEPQISISDSFNSVLALSLSRSSGVLSQRPSKINTIPRGLGADLQMTQPPSMKNGHRHKRSASEILAQNPENSGRAGRTGKLKILDSDSPVAYALIVDGQSLAYILAEGELQEEFLRVCISCASVLCCRVSPRQKAQVTKLVRKGLGQHRLCLAIGDGANDVGMIQAANVGVGITGVEGAQVTGLFTT